MSPENKAIIREVILTHQFPDGAWGWQYDPKKCPKAEAHIKSLGRGDLGRFGYITYDGIPYVYGYPDEGACLTDAYMDYCNLLPPEIEARLTAARQTHG